jgi:hypothetical protein
MNLGRRHLLTAMVLSLSGAITLAPTAHAQQRVAKPGVGFTFVMPTDYSEDDRVNRVRAQRGGPPVMLYLTDGGISREDNGNAVTRILLTGIFVMDIRAENKRGSGSVSVKVEGADDTVAKEAKTSDEQEVQDLYAASRRKMTSEEQEKMNAQIGKIAKSFLPPQFAYQHGAMVTIDGYPAIAILTSADSQFIQEEITGRFLVVPTKSRAYLFYCAYKNAEFEHRSKAFMNFMQSIKFNERPESDRIKKQATPSTTSTKSPKKKKQ